MNKFLKKVPLLLFLITWLLYFINTNKNFSINNIGDPDRYFQSFKFYLENDYYMIIKNGSSYLFNSVVWFFYSFTDSINYAFFLTNFISQIIVIIIGILLLLKVNKEVKSKYAIIIVLIFLCNTLSINAYHKSHNDMFQSIFVLTIFYLLFTAYYRKDKYHYLYGIIGVLCAICTLIRPTSLIVICITFVSVFLLEILKKHNFRLVLKSIALFIIPLLILISIFHYPSIKENKKLGFYNKDFVEEVNWVQRNYLAAKRMQSRELAINKNAIFVETPFSYVKAYLVKNGAQSLPSTPKEFVSKDPLLTLQLFIYNIVFTVLKASRFYAFMLLIPFLFLIKKPLIQLSKFPVYIFTATVLLICAIILTLMEYRWIIVYDILLCLGILVSLKFYEESKYKKLLHIVVNSSLIIVAIFNVLLTFYIKSSY